MKAFLALGSLVLLAACDVEPPRLPPLDASFPDAQPLPDVGPRDSGADAGEVATRPVRCIETDDCAAGDLCARPLVATSTVEPGTCTRSTALAAICESDAECAGDEICTAAGYCAVRALAVAGNLFSTCSEARECAAGETIASAGSIALVSSCDAPDDCGPAGICDGALGACVACNSNADCPRSLACQDGACRERSPCSIDEDCFPDNRCMSQRCVRRSTCRTDGGDSAATAVSLGAALYQGLGLCGDRDVGWWSFDLSGNEGARIALTSTRSRASIVMDLFDDTGLVVEQARWLSLPGLTVVEVAPPGRDGAGAPLTRSLRIRVQSLDHEGRYDLDLRRISSLCPGDALDQYGDRDPERALLVEGNRSHRAAACPEDDDLVRIDVDQEDQLLVAARFAGSATDLDLEASSGGTLIASSYAANTSSDAIDTGRIESAGTILLRTISKQSPSAGQDYALEVVQLRGSFFRACREIADLPLAGGAAMVQGDLGGAIDLGAPFCENQLYAAARRNDLLYRITPPSAPSLLRVLITPASDSTSEVTAALVSGCATESSTTLACDSAALPRRALQLEELLTHTSPVFLLVSSDGAAEDLRFDLEVLVEPVTIPANNSCAGAVEILQSGEIEVSTYGATNSVEVNANACGLFDDDGQGPDAFYRIRLSGGRRAALELAGPLDGLLWVATDCGQMTSTCTTAESISYVDPVAQVELTPASDRTFFIAVDGLDADDRGIYQLRTVFDPECLSTRRCAGNLRCDDYRCVPVPANDTCAGAQTITLDAQGRATVIASTGAANDSFQPTCLSRSDRDVVYRVDLPVARSALTARIVEARFDPALAIRRAQCEASLEEECNDDVRFPEEPQILLPEVTWMQPPAGTYYVIVDAFAGSGTFTLQIEALP